jgi:predicted dehydrogenase
VTRLGVAVIGLGVGQQHAEVYARRPDCRLVALCDLAADALERVGPRFPEAARVRDAATVLADPRIDVVSIASYDDVHAAQVIAALEHGKHVFVEKPLCLRRDEFDAIRAALARRPELKLSSNLILRKSPRFVGLRQMIADGTLGEVFLIEGDYLYGRIEKIHAGWRGRIDDYSVMHGGGIHLVDLLLWLTGRSVSQVWAVGNAIASRGSAFRYNDVVVSMLRFEDGSIGKVSANFGCVHPHFHGLAVYGTKATFVNGLESARLYTSRDPRVAPQPITTAYPGTHKGDLIDSFIDAILTGSPAQVTDSDVLRTMAVSLAIDESARRGSAVALSEFESRGPGRS